MSFRFNGALGNSLKDPLTKESLTKEIPEAIESYFGKFKCFVNITGHGAKNQLTEESLEKTYATIDKIVKDLDQQYGAGNWAAVYGGDPCNLDKPDVGMIVHRLYESETPVIAIQCDKYAPYIFKDGDANSLAEGVSYEVLKHGGAVVVYKTEEDNKGAIMFGGHDANYNPVGATRYVTALCGDKLRYHLAFGGGPVTAEEYDFFVRECANRKLAERPQLEVTYMKLEARYPTPIEEFLKLDYTEAEAKASAKYGIVDAFYQKDNSSSKWKDIVPKNCILL